MIALVAVDKNWGIGRNNTIPWKWKEDLAFFKERTQGKTIIVGKTTYKSLPIHVIKNRTILVLTKAEHFSFYDPGSHLAVATINFDNLTNIIADGKRDLVLAGGESVYNHFIKYCEEVFVSQLSTDYQCDKFFNPNLLDKFSKKQLIGIGGGTLTKYSIDKSKVVV